MFAYWHQQAAGRHTLLLHRCRELSERANKNEKFLIVTFTKTATMELESRLSTDPEFESIRDVTAISTLNSIWISPDA